MKVSLLLMFLSNVGLAQGLINGEEIHDDRYKEVIRIYSSGSSCSAAIVGERVILTAAHCTSEDGEIRPVSEDVDYKFDIDGLRLTARCSRHPLYNDERMDVDMALCKTSEPVRLDKYAHVAKLGEYPKVGNQVVLAGYGCLRKEAPRGGNDGVLRVGKSTVSRLPSGAHPWYHTNKQNDTESALCYGDSGGPSFRMMKDPKKEKHLVFGVNSRGDIKRLSMLTAMGFAKANEFIKSWSSQNELEICGIHKECEEGSPSPDPDPRPDPEPKPDDCMDEKRLMIYHELKRIEYEKKYNQCRGS